MIELLNGLIGIIIVYSIVKEIKEQEYITYYSSLCVLDTHWFIYIYDGKVVQIVIIKRLIIRELK